MARLRRQKIAMPPSPCPLPRGERGKEGLAGLRPRTTRSFCFGKRIQNHGHPGVALWVPLPRSRLLGLRNSLRSDSPRPHIEFGTGAQPRLEAPGDGPGYACLYLPSPLLTKEGE